MGAATDTSLTLTETPVPGAGRTWQFWLLLLVSAVTACLFTYDKLATTDSVLYAVGLQKIMAAGPQGWEAVRSVMADQFNGALAAGYYLGVWWLQGLVAHLIPSLVGLINGLSAVFSVIGLGLFFWLFYRLVRDRDVALWTGLAVLMAPSLWHIGHYGHPGIIAIAFFAASLVALDKMLVDARTAWGRRAWGLVFWVLAFVAVAVRLDTVLAFGAFYGLLLFRQRLTAGGFVRLTVACLAMAGGLALIRWLIFGAMLPPSAAEKMAWYIDPIHFPGGWALVKTVAKNMVYWAVGLNVLIAAVAAVGVIGLFFQKRWRLAVFLLAWALPWAVFLPFRAVDTHRLIAPSLPALCFLAMVFVAGMFRRRRWIGLAAVLILAQTAAVFSYQVLIRHYPFQTRFEGRYLASLPLGLPPVDHYYRQQYLDRIHHVAGQVARIDHPTVLIIEGTGSDHFYRWHLRQNRRVAAIYRYDCGDVALVVFPTQTNHFFFLNVSPELSPGDAIGQTLKCLRRQLKNLRRQYDPLEIAGGGFDLRVHVSPFWTRYPHSADVLFLSPAQVKALVTGEKKKAARRRATTGPE
jgi:hypothetical protein